MALSPEDVIKKSFKSTHMKRGYEETEVDDFLDEIVVELRRLSAENGSLRTDLEDCRASKGLPAGTTSSVAAGDLGAEQDDLDRVRRERDELVAEMEELTAQMGQSRGQLEQPVPAEVTDGELAGEGSAEEPTAIISLAQRLHDEHVAEGESTKARLVAEGETYRDTTVREADEYRDTTVREADEYRDTTVREADQRSAALLQAGQQRHDELVSEGQSTHDQLVAEGEQTKAAAVQEGEEGRARLVSEGEQSRDQMVNEAKQRRANVLSDLTAKQGVLQSKIAELASFESDYRSRFRELLAEQLGRLDQDERTA